MLCHHRVAFTRNYKQFLGRVIYSQIFVIRSSHGFLSPRKFEAKSTIKIPAWTYIVPSAGLADVSHPLHARLWRFVDPRGMDPNSCPLFHGVRHG